MPLHKHETSYLRINFVDGRWHIMRELDINIAWFLYCSDVRHVKVDLRVCHVIHSKWHDARTFHSAVMGRAHTGRDKEGREICWTDDVRRKTGLIGAEARSGNCALKYHVQWLQNHAKPKENIHGDPFTNLTLLPACISNHCRGWNGISKYGVKLLIQVWDESTYSLIKCRDG